MGESIESVDRVVMVKIASVSVWSGEPQNVGSTTCLSTALLLSPHEGAVEEPFDYGCWQPGADFRMFSWENRGKKRRFPTLR